MVIYKFWNFNADLKFIFFNNFPKLKDHYLFTYFLILLLFFYQTSDVSKIHSSNKKNQSVDDRFSSAVPLLYCYFL